MAIASDIIRDAYRESNIIASVSTPSTNELTEGLARLNSLILSTIGNEAGSELTDINIGGAYDQSYRCATCIPANVRLVLNLGSARTLNLHPHPYEGQRVAIADAAGTLGASNLALSGNGRQIEAASSLVLSTNGQTRQWLFRADTANWVNIASLIATDPMPLPTEFDDFFIVSLALRLNPRHSAKMAAESLAALERQRSQIRARYRRPRPLQDMGTLSLLGQGGVSDVRDSSTFNPLLP